MEATVPVGLEIALAFERTDEGSPEERAAFGMFSVRTPTQVLTEGFDRFLNGYRKGPLVSGYHAAEWLAWNWWRLRYEPRTNAPDWYRAHKMNAIGEGYSWPNLEIWSDGVRTMLISHPSRDPETKPFRYVGAFPTIVSSSLFQDAVDEFLPRVLGRLLAEDVPESNLDRLWRDVLAERSDPAISLRRRLEALLGRDPDAIEDDAVERLVLDADRLGEGAVEEVAAERARFPEEEIELTAQSLEATARSVGFAGSTRDAVSWSPRVPLPRQADVPAWKLGAAAAAALRDQEKLGYAALTDRRLTQFAGTVSTALTSKNRGEAALSYALDEPGGNSRIVLPQIRKTARRFALARLLGDRLMNRMGALHPATHTYTYRQKAQRSFAAELLAPFEAVEDMLRGDFSEDAQYDVADHFSVSPMVINTLLKNHNRIERDVPDEDFFAAVA